MQDFSINYSNNWKLTFSNVKKIMEAKYKSVFSLIDKQDRSKLSEGRSRGFATAMAKREGKNLITVCPLTACKDFISDIIYSEATGKPYSIYGLSYSKQNIFENGVGYMICSIEKTNRSQSEYGNYKRDYETLASNFKGMEKFINWFEEKFKADGKTKVSKLEENRYLVEFPLFWSRGTYLISLYILLLRVGIFYKEEEPMKYLKDFTYDNEDRYMLNTAMPKIERMLKGEIPKQDLSKCSSPHSTGILGYSF